MSIKIYDQICALAKLLFFLIFFSSSYAQLRFEGHSISESFSLHSYTTIADVGEKNLDIKYVISHFNTLNPVKLQTENDDLGFTQNNFWTKTTLINTSNVTLIYYLETARPITDVVDLYIVDSLSGIIIKKMNGDAMRYSDRSYDNRKTIFKIELPAQSSQQLYVHLKSDGEVIKIPMMLHSAESLIKMSSNENLFFGIFYGILLIVALIYFFFFFALKEKIFLFYSLYVLAVGLLQFALDGFFYQFISSDGEWFSNHALLLIAITAVSLSGKYSELFLRIKKNSKKIWILFQVAYGLLFILLLCIIFIPSILLFSYILVNVLTLVFLILIVYSILYLYFNKKPVDSFFTIGILFLILGFGIFILYNFGLLPVNLFTQNSSKIGTGLEVIFLSLSMSNLIRNLKNEKNELNRLALARSEEMNDLKSYFLSNISHELRTPLNAIMNLIDGIENEVQDDKIRQNCQIIKYSSHSLLSSVNDILDFSKIEKGELKLDKKPFNILEVLQNLTNNANNNAADKGLDFQFAKTGYFPDLVLGDANRFDQIVHNILNNAFKFTSNGFVKFDINCELLDNNKAHYILTVSDSGVGIPKKKIHSIFDSFSQNNINNKRKFGGLGLGLYIVKTLVDLHEGTIIINSKEEKGTTCIITLEYDIADRIEKEAETNPPLVAVLDGKSILVVEDNLINQMVIKMIAKKWTNTTFSYANNGLEAINAIKVSRYDLVLMDLQMPIMDGYEATIAIRNGEVGLQNSTIPIIAVTADVMETTKDRVKEIGMNDYLSKPIKKDVLFEAITKLI